MEAAAAKAWLVIYTKPRQEKKLAQRLMQAGYEVYLPTQRLKKRWSDRWKWVEMPLIPSHLFIQIVPQEREAVYYFPGFVRFLFWLKRPAQVPDAEIQTLKRWLNAIQPESAQNVSFQSGQKVQVLTGPFQGQFAMIEEVGAKTLTVHLDELQLKIQLDLSRNALEVLSMS